VGKYSTGKVEEKEKRCIVECYKNDELLEVIIISISNSLVSGWIYNYAGFLRLGAKSLTVVHHVAEIHRRVGLMMTV